jgi:hypothetical protein
MFNEKDVYENFQIVKNLPLVHKLMKKIEKLQRKNKELKQVVKILIKKECPKPKLEKTPTIYDGVEIKQEPDDDFIEIIEEPKIEFKVIDLEEEDEEPNIVFKGVDMTEEEWKKLEESSVEEEEEEEEEEEGDNGGESTVEEVEEEEDNGGESTVEEEEEEEDEVIEVTIKGKTYYTTDEKNGIIYDLDENGDISVEVGKYSNGKPIIKKK